MLMNLCMRKAGGDSVRTKECALQLKQLESKRPNRRTRSRGRLALIAAAGFLKLISESFSNLFGFNIYDGSRQDASVQTRSWRSERALGTQAQWLRRREKRPDIA